MKTKTLNRLPLLLDANGIDQEILKDPMLRMLIDEGDGVDALRYIERKLNRTFSTRDKLGFVEALENHQFYEPNPEAVRSLLGKEGTV